MADDSLTLLRKPKGLARHCIRSWGSSAQFYNDHFNITLPASSGSTKRFSLQ